MIDDLVRTTSSLLPNSQSPQRTRLSTCTYKSWPVDTMPENVHKNIHTVENNIYTNIQNLGVMSCILSSLTQHGFLDFQAKLIEIISSSLRGMPTFDDQWRLAVSMIPIFSLFVTDSFPRITIDTFPPLRSQSESAVHLICRGWQISRNWSWHQVY